MEFAAGDLADGNQLAAGKCHGLRFGDRRIAPAQEDVGPVDTELASTPR